MDILSKANKPLNCENNIDTELTRLIDLYGNDVLRISFMYLKDKYKAEDAFQEVFLRVYKNYAHFDGKSTEKTWILTITMNVCRDFLRSAWFKKIIFMNTYSETEDNYDIESRAIKSIEHEELLYEVMKLPSKYKEVILLYYYEELNTIEISKILNVSEGTVRSRLFRARKLLKNNINMEALL